MTAICAVVHDDKVWMGGDSAGVAGHSLIPRSDPKVFINGPFVMGFTSSFRMGQLLRWSFTVPSRVEDVSDEQYMMTTFIDAVRTCLKNGGYARKESEAEVGGFFLVGYKGQIWQVEQDYQVGMAHVPYAAVGSGDQLCLGALFATEDLIKDPEQRIKVALDAAERFNAGVRGPYVVIKEP